MVVHALLFGRDLPQNEKLFSYRYCTLIDDHAVGRLSYFVPASTQSSCLHVLFSLVFANVDATRALDYVSCDACIGSYVDSYVTGTCITVGAARNAAVISSLASVIGMGGVPGESNHSVLGRFHISSVSLVVFDCHSSMQ